MNYYEEFTKKHPEENTSSTFYRIFCASNRVCSLKTLKEEVCAKNVPLDLIENSSHHYSTKQVAKTYERLHEKYFGMPARERWFGEVNREKFNKLRKFINKHELELNSHISLNMQSLVNFCTYRGMPFRVAMLCTVKSLTRSMSKMKDHIRTVGNAEYEGADTIYDDLYSSEYLLAEQYFEGVPNDDPDMHRIGIRQVKNLSEYYIANTPRIFSYVLDHDCISYSKLEILDAISEKMSKSRFKDFVEEKHLQARICAAQDLCETIFPGCSEKILLKKNMNMLTPKFWTNVRSNFRFAMFYNADARFTSAKKKTVSVSKQLGSSLYG